MTTLAQLHDCHSCNDERSIVQKKRAKDEVEFTTLSGYPAKTLSETLSSKLQLNTFKSPKD